MLFALSQSDAQPDAPLKGNGEVVMIVEDEPVIREFLCEMLADEGLKIEAYGTADDAWAAFADRSKHFDLLLTDIRMPGAIDGAELARRVQREWPQMPIIVMSGHETPDTADIGKVSAFVPKPWAIGTLTDEVLKAINLEKANRVG